MALKIHTAPRLAEGVGLPDVFAEWLSRALCTKITKPHTGESYVSIRIGKQELDAVHAYVLDPPVADGMACEVRELLPVEDPGDSAEDPPTE